MSEIVWLQHNGQAWAAEHGSDDYKTLVKNGAVLTEAPAGQKGLSDLTIAELKDIAAERGVDLGDASKKADILAVLEPEPEGATLGE